MNIKRVNRVGNSKCCDKNDQSNVGAQENWPNLQDEENWRRDQESHPSEINS